MINDEYVEKNTDMLRENLLNINGYIFRNLKNFNVPLKDFVNGFESQILEHVLLLTNGNQKRAAFLLGVNRSTLCEKVKRYRILLHNFSNIEIASVNYQEIISPFLENYHFS